MFRFRCEFATNKRRKEERNKILRKPPVDIAAGATDISMNSRNKRENKTVFQLIQIHCLLILYNLTYHIILYYTCSTFQTKSRRWGEGGKRKSPHIECTSTCAGLLVTPEHLMKYNRHGRHGKWAGRRRRRLSLSRPRLCC